MRKFYIAGGVVILVATAAWYWIGTGSQPGIQVSQMASNGSADKLPASPASNASRRTLYWQDTDGKLAYSATPIKTADGREYTPVYEDSPAETKNPSAKLAIGKTLAENGTRKIKYYRNPMGLPDTSPTPKKDSMGMDYIPVYEGEDTEDGSVKLSPGKIQRSGAKSEPVVRQPIRSVIRVPGTIQQDERRVSVVALRFEGFVESVANVTTGDHVTKGQPLMNVYSPALSSAAAE